MRRQGQEVSRTCYAFPVSSRGKETANETLVDSSFVTARQTVSYAINKPPSTSRFGASLTTVSPSSVTNRVENDALGRRTATTRSGAMMSEAGTDYYGYNVRSELVSATKDGVDEYAYQYDDIGNRLSSLELGTNNIYTANSLNQYTMVGRVAPRPPEDDFAPQYDEDGNQTLVRTATGIWSVTYNAENRPVRWTRGSTVVTMDFDSMGRRTFYRETENGRQVTFTRFFYDGYLMIQQLFSNSPYNIYKEFIWDPTEPVATKPLCFRQNGQAATFLTHDGNKNVTDVIRVAPYNDLVGHYEYAPFGAVRSQTGSRASANPYRFSSEFADDTLGLVYYNYRHYEPMTGRWLTRDGVQTKEVYGIVHNSLLNGIDVLGALEDGRKSCKIDKTQINCLGYAIGADYCVDPHYMSIDGLMVALGYRGSSVPDTECKCDPCDAKVVYVYIYINPGLFARLNAKGNVDFEALSGDERNRLYDLYRRIFLEGNPNPFAMEDFWCNGGDGVVDYHAMTKECCRDSSKWYYVAARFDREDPRGRARQLERKSYFPNKHQIVAGKCYKKER